MAADDRSGSSPGELPVSPHSAVDRLADVKTHQWSFAREMGHNWRGWLGSLVFHAALVALLMTITWTIFHEEPGVPIDLTPMKRLPKLAMEPLPPPIDPALEETNELTVDAQGEKESVGYPGLDEWGLPDWIGRGPLRDGPGTGGPPGIPPNLERILKDYRKLDVVFVFDSTGSMGGIILEVKTRIRQFMKVVTYLVPNTQLGLVTYRDLRKYAPEEYEYAAKYTPLTKPTGAGLEKLQAFLRETQAYGGGDIPEAVYDGLVTAIRKAEWRKEKDVKKIIIVFGDAPPRPEQNGLGKIYKLCGDWHNATGGMISCIDTTGASKLLEEFKEMAAAGGGQSCFLNDERAIIKQLVLYIFPPEAAPDIEFILNHLLRDAEETIIEK